MSFVETKCSLTYGIKCTDKVTITETEVHNHKGCSTNSFLLLGWTISTHWPVQQFPRFILWKQMCKLARSNWVFQKGSFGVVALILYSFSSTLNEAVPDQVS